MLAATLKITLKQLKKMQQSDKIKVIVSCGGTGGHIFPAIAVADAVKKRYPNAEIQFVGAKGRMEMEKVPQAGYPIEGLWISGLQRKITIDNLMFPFKVLSSFIKARRIISRFKPDVAIGTGGYASWATLRAAASAGIPCIIQEQNSFPGIANKRLASVVNTICVAFSGMEKYFPVQKIKLLGNPVRADLLQTNTDPDKAREAFGLKPGVFTVLVIGGSLGALTINKSIHKLIAEFEEKGLQLIWQTGKSYAQTASEAIEKVKGSAMFTAPFIRNMKDAYAAADVIISRAGAIAISEMCIIGKPVILVPSPNVTEDHQTKNAMALVEKEAAVLVRDNEAVEKLGEVIFQIMNDQSLKTTLAQNIKKLAMPEASDNIAEEALKLIKRK